jgi:hypothetical protein
MPFASVMLMFPVVFYVTHTSGRYRYPMDPMMTILAVFAFAYPLAELVKWLGRPRLLSLGLGAYGGRKVIHGR